MEVVDWRCNNCLSEIPFCGIDHGIFATRKEGLYSTELMYSISCGVFQHSFSVRGCNGHLSGLCKTPSIINAVMINKMVLNVVKKRRRVNEAFMTFMTTLTSEYEELTKGFFTCPECEVPLNERDKLELGLTGDHPNLRRLKGVVIDGTSAGTSSPLLKTAETNSRHRSFC